MLHFIQYLLEEKKPELRTFRHGSFFYHPQTNAFHSWPDLGGDGSFYTHSQFVKTNRKVFGLTAKEHKALVKSSQDGDFGPIFDRGWVRGLTYGKTVVLHGRHLPSIVSAVRSHFSNPHNVEHTYSIALEKPNFTTTDYSLRTPTHVDRFLSSRGAPHRDYIIRYV